VGDELSILSWNIHGLNSDKKSCKLFVDILAKNDICFLYESWCNVNSYIELNGYISHNFYRKFQHKNARRSSAGAILYYRECLKDDIAIVKNHFDSIIWVKLDNVFFNIEKDVYLCCAYIWGDNSPVYNTFNVDLFNILEIELSVYDKCGSVYLCGDFNSRVGQKCDLSSMISLTVLLTTLIIAPTVVLDGPHWTIQLTVTVLND